MSTEPVVPQPQPAPPPLTIEDALMALYPWQTGTLPGILAKLGELKRAYDHVAALVLARQQRNPPKHHCWSFLHRKDGYNGGAIPESVLGQCRKIIPDGKWSFRDDGNTIRKHGINVREPVMCCSPLCANMYQRWRNDNKQRAKGAATAEEAGIEVR